MNIDPFKVAFNATASEPVQPWDPSIHPEVEDLIRQVGGTTYNHGLYRVLTPSQYPVAKEAFERMHPKYEGKLAPFGYDWMGRHFAVDLHASTNGNPRVLMMEPGTGSAFVIPVTVETFHNEELVESHDDALASGSWTEWRETHPDPLPHSKCVGYRKPLFLGGEDDFPNYEIGNLEIYIEFCSQVWDRIRDLPEGTPIKNIQWKWFRCRKIRPLRKRRVLDPCSPTLLIKSNGPVGRNSRTQERYFNGSRLSMRRTFP